MAIERDTEWQSASGLPDDMTTTAEARAKRLLTYISNPSTVYSLTKHYFGESPSVEQITQWRKSWEVENAIRQKRLEIKELPETRKERIKKVNKALGRKAGRPKTVIAPNELAEYNLKKITICNKAYRAFGFSAAEIFENKDKHLGDHKTAIILATALMRAYGIPENIIGKIYHNIGRAKAADRIRHFFRDGLEKEKYRDKWDSVAPERFKGAYTLEEFKALLKE